MGGRAHERRNHTSIDDRTECRVGRPQAGTTRSSGPCRPLVHGQCGSLASARAAYQRLEAAARPLTAHNFLRLSDEELKQIGFSRQKTAYGRNLAHAVAEGRLDLANLSDCEDEDVRSRLTAIKGIGQWTADIYLLMAMGRPDIWPSGDLALAVAVQEVKGMPARPTPAEMNSLSEAWRPLRAVAARLLWHYYLSRQ